MRRLGFKEQLVFDLISLLMVTGLFFGKLFSPVYVNALIRGDFLPSFIGEPPFLPAVLFFGILTFYYFGNKRNISIFEVGDQLVTPILVGHFLVDLLPIIQSLFYRGGVFLLPLRVGVLAVDALLLIIINALFLNRGLFRGLRLSLMLTLFIIVTLSEAVVSAYALTFWVLSLILLMLGGFRRLKQKYMTSPSNFLANLKDRLFKKKQRLSERQLHLPQEDPFLSPHREDYNSDDDDVDEQAGHARMIAESDFIDEETKQTEKALGKLEKGTYGICEKCGLPIDPARLQADPSATLCIDCAKKLEPAN